MLDEEVKFTVDEATLAGSFVSPERSEPGPAALLVVGSGPVDRNSDHKKLPLDLTRQLAEHLADHGIATLRYDKRGIGASGGDYPTTGFYDNVSDAAAALEALRARPEVDPGQVFVIGHSEGALITAALGAAHAPVAGVVLLSGTAQTGEEVLMWQSEQVARFLPSLVRAITRVFGIDVTRSQAKRLAKIKASSQDVVRVQGVVKLNAKWFREFMEFDPAPALAEIEVPILAITGSDDVQVDPADIARMETLATAPFEGHVVEGVNHILRRGGPSPMTYKRQVAEPVDGEVLDLVTDWLDRQLGSSEPDREAAAET